MCRYNERMLVLTSPAKSLDFSSKWKSVEASEPEFAADAGELVRILAGMSAKEIGDLMKISPKLSKVNLERFGEWQEMHTSISSKPAILAYVGDIFKQMKPQKYDVSEQMYAQRTIRIVSGLYGLLRAYDLIQPYRLEMKTKLAGEGFEDLYGFWGSKLTERLNTEIAEGGHELVVNLASREYAKAIDLERLNASVVTVEFKDKKDGKYKTVGILAKKARGVMMEYLVQNKIEDENGVVGFVGGGYKLDQRMVDKWVFTRG